MKKKLYAILTILMITMLATTPAFARGNIKLSGSFDFGSLSFTGTMTGIGGFSEGVNVFMSASGTPLVLCTNKGGTEAPGQNPPKVTAEGVQLIPEQEIDDKGRSDVLVVAETDSTLSGKEGGCPNNKWAAEIIFVFWEAAHISVVDALTGDLLLEQFYSCVTTRHPDNTGSVECTLDSEISYH